MLIDIITVRVQIHDSFIYLLQNLLEHKSILNFIDILFENVKNANFINRNFSWLRQIFKAMLNQIHQKCVFLSLS